jgi:diguanylate cyclase (GGDEF)-like protein
VARVAPVPLEAGAGRPSLVSIHGAHLGKRWGVPAAGLSIGRDPALAELALPDAAVSGRHCVLELDRDGALCVLDLGSRNGTFVNGEKVERRALADGDRIFVGDTVLKFTLHDEIEASFHTEIDRRMNIDALTGLLVKRAFDVEFARVFADAAPLGGALAVLMMDMDGLKSINDDKGHQMGSLCISKVGTVIREEVEGAGRACRFGGDEFIAFLHPCSIEAGEALAERIRARVQAYEFEREGVRVHPTISIGIAMLRADLPTPDHLLQAADEALYRAKRAGRNRVSR